MGNSPKNELDDFPWPSKDDRLFEKARVHTGAASTGSPEFDGILESLRPELAYFYREGYYEAGQVLASHMWQSDAAIVLYPTLYCFRHYVELSIKSLIGLYAGLEDDLVKPDLHKRHGLTKLWNEARALIEKAEGDEGKDDGTLNSVERCLNELNEVDCNSQLFRYPSDPNGESFEHRLPRVCL
ncbi:MAG: hypothetical protein WBE26_05860, partial [Phycisphaerae bacterium]